MNSSRNVRKWAGVLITAILYFLIHEGAHSVYALFVGAFRKINMLGLGVQVEIIRDVMTDVQFGIFNLVGAIATLLCAYILVGFSNKITRCNSKWLKAVMYYLTLGLLFADPLYLLILFQFVGGGDMNGIIYLMPQVMVQIMSGVLLVFNFILFMKLILPRYRAGFEK